MRHTDAFGYLKGTSKTFDLIYIAPPQYKHLWSKALQQIAERPELLHGASEEADRDQSPGMAIVRSIRESTQASISARSKKRDRGAGNTLLVFYSTQIETHPEPAVESE